MIKIIKIVIGVVVISAVVFMQAKHHCDSTMKIHTSQSIQHLKLLEKVTGSR